MILKYYKNLSYNFHFYFHHISSYLIVFWSYFDLHIIISSYLHIIISYHHIISSYHIIISSYHHTNISSYHHIIISSYYHISFYHHIIIILSSYYHIIILSSFYHHMIISSSFIPRREARGIIPTKFKKNVGTGPQLLE